MDKNLEENAPTTVKEIGIHLSYMQQDIRDLKQLISDQGNHFVTRDEHRLLEERVGVLESGVRWLVGTVILGVVGTILRMIGLWK